MSKLTVHYSLSSFLSLIWCHVLLFTAPSSFSPSTRLSLETNFNSPPILLTVNSFTLPLLILSSFSFALISSFHSTFSLFLQLIHSTVITLTVPSFSPLFFSFLLFSFINVSLLPPPILLSLCWFTLYPFDHSPLLRQFIHLTPHYSLFLFFFLSPLFSSYLPSFLLISPLFFLSLPFLLLISSLFFSSPLFSSYLLSFLLISSLFFLSPLFSSLSWRSLPWVQYMGAVYHWQFWCGSEDGCTQNVPPHHRANQTRGRSGTGKCDAMWWDGMWWDGMGWDVMWHDVMWCILH